MQYNSYALCNIGKNYIVSGLFVRKAGLFEKLTSQEETDTLNLTY